MKTLHKYCKSLNRTKSAESTSPTPILKNIRHAIGIISRKNANVNVMPSIMQNTRNTVNVSPKLIRDEMLREKRNRYFGMFIFILFYFLYIILIF